MAKSLFFIIYTLITQNQICDVDVSADKLYQDYKDSFNLANKVYFNKKVFIRGKVIARSVGRYYTYLNVVGVVCQFCVNETMTGNISNSVIILMDNDTYMVGESFDKVCVGAGQLANLPLLCCASKGPRCNK